MNGVSKEFYNINKTQFKFIEVEEEFLSTTKAGKKRWIKTE